MDERDCILPSEFYAMMKDNMQAANSSTSTRIPEPLMTRLPLMWFSLAFLMGIVLAKLLPFSEWVWIVLTLASIALLIISQVLAPTLPPNFTFPLRPFTFVLITALFLGGMRYQISVPHFNAFHIAFYNDRDYDVLVTGIVVEPPDYRDNYTNLRVQVTHVDTGDRQLPANGLILVRVSNNQVFHYGDIIRLRGKLKTPPENEDFSYRDYLAGQLIHSYMSSAEVTVLPGKGGNPFSRAMYALKERS